MDDKDRLVLHILEENSRVPIEELATMVELPVHEAEDRIRALEAAGAIRKYSAVIDWEKAGDSEVTSIIALKVSPERDFGYDKIAERIARFREVKTLRLVSGRYDFIIVVTGRTMQEVARFVSEHIAPMERINETSTQFVMKTYKENGTPYDERIAGERLPYSF
ncbi:Lrp/AsnC family transcriptional regulator [Methanofollis aquaemaris]|uniref:Lrp/AsnC family transcriptional regulator n=1 Tax=Methanofollis aquaemaris TaxID=126734 RepID=A0A8A3S6F4_9EURY|nr:Lrp/AsnC family transcriptional regulator [Methanofollis aquaemaris]QSZ67449.1 Lrp/AsnC family transcriptional regulator [Methanofollis aquaemaris]